MEAGKGQTGAATTAAGSPALSAAVDSCGWMKIEAKDGSFMTKFKDQFSGFIHAPMDKHKACFKTTMQKMAGKFSLPKSKQDYHVEAQATPEK